MIPTIDMNISRQTVPAYAHLKPFKFLQSVVTKQMDHAYVATKAVIKSLSVSMRYWTPKATVSGKANSRILVGMEIQYEK